MTTPMPTHLTTAECWTLLESETLGRLALIGDDGVPDLFPVNYVAHEGAIYIRTAHDSKILRIVAHPVAGFEVDGSEGDEVWSVVVRGAIARLTDDAEIERVGARRIVSWSPRQKPYVIKLTAHTVTGRRFVKVDRAPSRPVHPADRVAADPAPAAQPSDVPFNIPSLPPRHPGLW
ncbi:pyridoxamine 5'-phosphate oxidase family protein [Microbacterium sp. NPDC057407]|uniref:pyridoxamine 5'-phosphate oxidase family protein n=1 Tax=Microbacterium sp. NPDC057407 TaxID=3346120 RepID=UPI0036712F2F